jgi:hypothetical protein
MVNSRQFVAQQLNVTSTDELPEIRKERAFDQKNDLEEEDIIA